MTSSDDPTTISAAADSPVGKAAPRRVGKKRQDKCSGSASAPRTGSKTAKILSLLRRRSGASLQQLRNATGWQAHSVRGFLSGTIKKKMGLRVHQSKLSDGTRSYRIRSK
jgi:hypothetical protein